MDISPFSTPYQTIWIIQICQFVWIYAQHCLLQLLVLIPYTSGQSSTMPNPNVYGRDSCHLSSFSPAVHENFLLTSTLCYTFLPSTTADHSIYNSDMEKKKKEWAQLEEWAFRFNILTLLIWYSVRLQNLQNDRQGGENVFFHPLGAALA